MTTYELLKKKLPKTAYSEKLSAKILVWTKDYEKEWYLLDDPIPKEAKWLWVNHSEVKLYIFERLRNGKWKIVQRSDPLDTRAFKRIHCGPAFVLPPAPPAVLKRNPVTDWFQGSTCYIGYELPTPPDKAVKFFY